VCRASLMVSHERFALRARILKAPQALDVLLLAFAPLITQGKLRLFARCMRKFGRVSNGLKLS
jgi:hypothetical protein